MALLVEVKATRSKQCPPKMTTTLHEHDTRCARRGSYGLLKNRERSRRGRESEPAARGSVRPSPPPRAARLSCLNACKGLARGGKNDCAGQGTCATATAHGCGGRNAARARAAVAPIPMNSCKGKGACGVPITMNPAWDKARKALEELAKSHGFELGPAPKRG